MTPSSLQIEEENLKSALDNPLDASLASGLAGALLMEVQLYGQWPTTARRRHIEQLIEALVGVIQTRELSINLWCGLVGVLYAFEFTRAISDSLLPPVLREFIASMDEQLIAYLAGSAGALHFDLITGVVGIGAYALMRTDLAAAKRLYAAVEVALLELSILSEGGRVWVTKAQFTGPLAPEQSRLNGHVDLGLAHGLPGVVQLFAGALRHGLAGVQTAQWLREATTALICRQGEAVNGARYAYYCPQIDSEGSRLAWCYGDLSAGFAIHSAAQALQFPEWQVLADRLVLERITQPEETLGLNDGALCHGHAGVMHLVKKLAADCASSDYSTFIHARLRELGTSASGYGCLPGFLEGSGGVLMALYDGPARERHHWDVCLCMGF